MNEGLLDEFTKNTSPEFEKIVGRLAGILEGSGEPLEAAIKWNRLTYAYRGDFHRGDFHHWICGISITKKTVDLVFHFGGLLEDPQGVFTAGSSAFLRKIKYQTAEEVDENSVLEFLRQAFKRLEYFKANWKEIQKGKTPG